MSQTRATILDGAKHIVSADRQNDYGTPESNFGLIAAYWSAHLDHAVTASDVAVMLAQVKMARIKTSPGKSDNWVDLAGYAACGGEIACGGAA